MVGVQLALSDFKAGSKGWELGLIGQVNIRCLVRKFPSEQSAVEREARLFRELLLLLLIIKK